MFLQRLKRVSAALQRQSQRHRTRRQLLNLDQRLLDDIGIEHSDAEREARKPFWKI